MTVPGSMEEHLLAVGLSHRTAPLPSLERLALSGTRGARILRELASHDAIHEAVVLSTCNRTEVYLVVSDSFAAERTARAMLCREAHVASDTLRLQSFRAADAVRHLFRVAAGLESMVVGETEIQGQVRRAYKLALLEGVTGPITSQVFRAALEAGKRVRDNAPSPRSQPSVASVAVDLAGRTLGGLAGRRAVVVGAGENAELTGRALVGHGARVVFVANRRLARARTLAGRVGARAVAFEWLWEELIEADLAFACAASRSQIATVDDLASVMEQRPGRPLLLIDTGVPRNVHPGVRDLPHVELYDLDRLRREVAAGVTASAAETDESRRVIDSEVTRFTAWLASRDVLPAISALREHADTTANRVVGEHEPFLESPSPDDRERVRMVAQAVVTRLLHEPTTRLKRIPEGGESHRYARALLELFGLDPTGPTSHGAGQGPALLRPGSRSSDDARDAATAG